MVSQFINVIVNSKGAVTVRRELTAIGDSARETTTYLNGLRAVLAAALTFSGASQIVETIDNFTVLQNRLRQVAQANETVSESWERLMGIAERSYSTIDSTVSLYFRVAQAYKAWGESAESAYQFTESFQKAAILSGSSMQTTSQAVYQFSQALNKGKLDGDEFRSVLEGLPYVASLIQKSLGVTRSQLYEMSADGQISLDRIKQAFESAAKTIESDFLKITPTIGMAMGLMRNQWINFLGEVQNATGVFSVVARGIILVADNFQALAIALAPVVASLGFLAGRLALGLVITGLKDMAAMLRIVTPLVWLFNAAMSANPFVLAAMAIAAVVAAVIYFREELGLTNEVLLGVWEAAKSVFGYILTTLSPITAAVNMLVQAFGGWKAVWEGIKSVAQATVNFLLSTFKTIGTTVVAVANYMKRSFAPVFADLIELGKSYYELIVEIVTMIKDMLTPAIEALTPAARTVWGYMQPMFRQYLKFLTDIFDGWKMIGNWLSKNFFPFIKQAFEGWIVIIRSVIDAIKGLIDVLRAAVKLMNQVAGGGGGGGAAAPGMNYGGQFYAGEFANGGSFKTPGTGVGRDTTAVAFRANRGERVTVETKKQQRQADNSNGVAPSVNVPVQLINVLDPSMVPAANETAAGQRSIINVIKANRDEINYALGIS